MNEPKFKLSSPTDKVLVFHYIHGKGYIFSYYRNMFQNEYVYEIILIPTMEKIVCRESEITN